MPNFFKIPLSPQPQRIKVRLGAVTYQLTLKYANTVEGGWVMDIADENANPIINGIPLITGRNLLEPYPQFGFAGRMWVQTADDPDAVPTFDNLGVAANLYWVTD